MMINLADEIMEIFAHYGYTRADIDWVGNFDFRVDQNWFFTVADNTTYDNGYGSTCIPRDLLIMMKDGCWFSRREYDGSEWFVINRVPPKPAVEKQFIRNDFIVPYEHRYDLDADFLRWFIEY